MAHIQHSVVIPVARKDLFEFISDYKKRTRLMPPDLSLELTSIPLELKKGAEHDFKISRWGLNYSFTLLVEHVEAGESFTERSQFGVFEEWVNTFKLEDHGENSTLLTNIIDYKLPLGVVGTLMDDLWMKNDMSRILSFAHKKLKSFFE
jgi:ligand-binding SRPBCC domain-containing protein